MPNPRQIIKGPLENAAPTLQPTARPVSIQIGATPPPRRSPLAELGEAFANFNPHLNDLLQYEAARADQDALSMGEQQAIKDRAAGRMGEIEKTLKGFVDSGQLSNARLPAFERGYRTRQGADLASGGFQEYLSQKVAACSSVDNRQDPEKVYAEAYQQFAGKLGKEDRYGREAFDTVAQNIAAGFRREVSATYTANLKDQGEELHAQHLGEGFMTLAKTVVNNSGAVATVKQMMDEARKSEFPIREYNAFVVERSIVPTVRRLVADNDFESAHRLLDFADNFDLTGKGGFLGKTEAASKHLPALREFVEAKEHQFGNQRYAQIEQAHRMTELNAQDEAATAIADLHKAGTILDYSAQQKALAAYRQKEKDPLKVQMFEKHFAVFTDGARQAKYDRKDSEDIKASLVTTIDPARLSAIRARLENAFRSGLMPPQDYPEALNLLQRKEALVNIGIPEETQKFIKALYLAPSVAGMGPMISFGGKTNEEVNQDRGDWDKLTPQQKTQHSAQVAAQFQIVLMRKLTMAKSEEDARTRLPELSMEAQAETLPFVRSLLRQMVPQEAKEAPSSSQEAPKAKGQEEPDVLLPIPREPASGSDAWRASNRAALSHWWGSSWSTMWDQTTKDYFDGLDSTQGLSEEEQGKKFSTYQPTALKQVVSTKYAELAKYREDLGGRPSRGYNETAKAFGLSLLKYGGADLLTDQQLIDVGLKPAAFRKQAKASMMEAEAK